MLNNNSGKIVLSYLSALGKAMSAAALLVIIPNMPAVASSESLLCGSRPTLLGELSKRYHEEPVALGLTSDGSLIEVLTSDGGSTWTIMVRAA